MGNWEFLKKRSWWSFQNLFKDLIQGSQKIEPKDVVPRLNENCHQEIIQEYSKQKDTDKIRGCLLYTSDAADE